MAEPEYVLILAHKLKFWGKPQSQRSNKNGSYKKECILFFLLQVLIQETGERRYLGVGVVDAMHVGHGMPGWLQGSVGYHVDDGKIFDSTNRFLGREVEGKTSLVEIRS